MKNKRFYKSNLSILMPSFVFIFLLYKSFTAPIVIASEDELFVHCLIFLVLCIGFCFFWYFKIYKAEKYLKDKGDMKWPIYLGRLSLSLVFVSVLMAVFMTEIFVNCSTYGPWSSRESKEVSVDKVSVLTLRRGGVYKAISVSDGESVIRFNYFGVVDVDAGDEADLLLSCFLTWCRVVNIKQSETKTRMPIIIGVRSTF